MPNWLNSHVKQSVGQAYCPAPAYCQIQNNMKVGKRRLVARRNTELQGCKCCNIFHFNLTVLGPALHAKKCFSCDLTTLCIRMHAFRTNPIVCLCKIWAFGLPLWKIKQNFGNRKQPHANILLPAPPTALTCESQNRKHTGTVIMTDWAHWKQLDSPCYHATTSHSLSSLNPRIVTLFFV